MQLLAPIQPGQPERLYPGGEPLNVVPPSFGSSPQTLRSQRSNKPKAAKSATLEEVQDFVRDVQAKLRELFPDLGPEDWIWSWDNPRCHGRVGAGSAGSDPGDWERLGITTANHSGLPPYGPDLHNVIEQSHAILERALQVDINRNPDKPLTFFIERLQYYFKEQLDRGWGERAVRRLFQVTLPEILRKKGFWGKKGTR